jgi:glyoxylase-like metal-dependent hydrolase (beta-lactamase superfamily II)/predicted ester cyclase
MSTPTQESEAEAVATAYLDAISARDIDAAVAYWAPGGLEHIHGQRQVTAPEGVREFVEELLRAFPDLRFERVETATDGDKCYVRSVLTGTFAGPGTWTGIEPTGARIELPLVDCLVVRDGRIVRNDAYLDGLTVARQLGMMPAQGAAAEQRMTKAFNAKTRLGSRLAAAPPEQIAEGVWVVRGGFPGKTMNVYLVRDGDGVLAFDGGVRSMTNAVAAAGASLGGITRVVLGHAHADHRGTAPGLRAPVFVHPADKADAEGDGGLHYMDLSKLNPLGRRLMPRLLRSWDGGPVEISGTVEEGEHVAGFEVVHLPGHAPGLIGLWRASDRLALVTDCFYTLDPQSGKKGHARVPHAAFNLDTEQARASIRKLAALEPAAAWAGHGDPVTGDVKGILEHAAATT